MDPSDGLTEEERLHLGAQQAAMISLQEEMQMQRDDMVVRPPQHGIMGPDSMDPNLIQMQAAALAEQEKEAELMHQQQMAILERNREEQMMKQQVMLASGPPSQPTPSQSMPPPPGLSAPRMQPPPAPPSFQTAGPPSSHMMGPPGITSGNQHIAPPPPGLTAPPLQPPQSTGTAPPGTNSGPVPHRMRPPPSFSQPPSGPPGTQPMTLSHGPPGISSAPPSHGMPPSSQPGPPGLSGDRNSSGFSTDGPTHPSQSSGGMRGPPPPGFGRRLESQPSNQGPPPADNSGPPSLEEDQPQEVKLPTALEKVLAFKGERASQVGVAPEDIEKVEKGEIPFTEEEDEEMAPHYNRPEMTIGEEYGDEDEEEQEPPASAKKESKNKKKKKKKKKARQRRFQSMNISNTEPQHEDDVEIEYIQEAPAFDSNDPMYSQFADIFKAFKIDEPEKAKAEEEAPKEEVKKEAPKPKGILDSDDDDDDDDDDARAKDDDDKPKISKKKLKKISRLSVAELKQLVHRPDVVEMHDVTARDPKLLVLIKATRNTVTVPRHWCFKRKYLQGKRGIEKPPFELPEYIKQTGVMEMRAALAEKEDQKSMKQKMRERVRPKMGKIDIDYQKLHDAFFKWQIKPKMTIHGDLYYEGKEFETRLKEKKPGNLSDDLRTALGMPIGDNAEKVPPPWLIAMQRYGPPPSYPNLKIPGLNAPIPESCSFGYHAGGWGKPPVDENGKPLYGDVFGVQGTEVVPVVTEDDIDKSHWGELESESESEEESEDESEEEAEGDMTGLVTPGETGLVTPSGVVSVPIGVETPDMIELRKRRIEDAIDQGGDTPALYTVLPEKKATVGAAMMGSAHVYDMTAVGAGAAAAKGRPGQPGAPNVEGVDIALNPEELDLDTAAMQAKYEQTMREQQQSQLEKEDLSDMVAEHAAKQQKKRKKQQQDGKSAKKYKDFKF